MPNIKSAMKRVKVNKTKAAANKQQLRVLCTKTVQQERNLSLLRSLMQQVNF